MRSLASGASHSIARWHILSGGNRAQAVLTPTCGFLGLLLRRRRGTETAHYGLFCHTLTQRSLK